MNRAVLLAEKAKRELEKRNEAERWSLYQYILTMWSKEKKIDLDENRHIKEICNKLEKVYRGEIKRLIINMPPRALKTELISIAFPAWVMWLEPSKKFMSISYSSELAQKNSGKCRSSYLSNTYRRIFPRRVELKSDQNTKQHRENIEGGQYYAAWSTGTITGVGADIILIDDPLKPDDANSDTVRTGVNNNFHDTIESRLNSKVDGAIIIIMQRLHDDDLCGHLMDLEDRGLGDKWEKLIIPAIAEQEEEHRKKGESFFPKRFPIEILNRMKGDAKMKITFSTQYQQNPVNKETQEFHEEWIRYHWTDNVPTPHYMRIFTTCDPAFKQNQENDNSCIMTAGFVDDRMYILEYSVGKWTADVLIEKIIYHIKKREPEKVGIEAFQAQTVIAQFLKNDLQKRGLYVNIEEITQRGDKFSKIRKLIPHYRAWLIFHKHWMDELENEMKRFPRGKHDDIIDAEQMLYDLYVLQPNTVRSKLEVNIEYNANWTPIYHG